MRWARMGSESQMLLGCTCGAEHWRVVADRFREVGRTARRSHAVADWQASAVGPPVEAKQETAEAPTEVQEQSSQAGLLGLWALHKVTIIVYARSTYSFPTYANLLSCRIL